MKRIDLNRYNAVVPIKQAAEQDLIKIPGVTGIGIGYKQVSGQETDDMSILIFVKRKGFFDSGSQIPDMIQGVKTDVIECEFFPISELPDVLDAEPDVAPNPTRYDPLIGGCSASKAVSAEGTISAGTLGVMVKDNATGATYALSNWHVFCENAQWSDPGQNKNIVQPGTLDGGTSPGDVMGMVQRGHVGQIERSFAYDWYVDCAVCSIQQRATSKNILSIGILKGSAEPIVGELVKKTGRTTQFTYGVCADTNMTTSINYGGTTGVVWFYYQYRFTPPAPGMPIFSAPGDSGSVITDSENNAVALLFGGGTSSTGASYSIGNPMYMVLGAMNISLLTQ